MKQKKMLVPVIIVVSMLLIPSITLATPSANILYDETDLGNGWWQYDYTVENTSTGNWGLFELELTFKDDFGNYFYTPVTDSALPTGWGEWYGRGWQDVNSTNFRRAYSFTDNQYDTTYDITPGNSLSGFSFAINTPAGSIPYKAFFRDLTAQYPSYQYVNGETTLVPEPGTLLLLGSGFMGLAFYDRRKFRK